MLESLVATLSQFVIHYGAFGVFVATLIEEIIAPIPSAAIIAGSAFFLFQNEPFSLQLMADMLFILAIPGALGMTVGSLLYYWIAYRFGKPTIERWGGYMGIGWGDIERVQKYFTRGYSDELILFLLRTAPIVPSIAINLVGGLVRYRLLPFIVITFLGNVVHAYIVGFLGWYAADAYTALSALDTISKILIAALGALALIAFITARMRASKI